MQQKESERDDAGDDAESGERPGQYAGKGSRRADFRAPV
jgi:hypothetical protein